MGLKNKIKSAGKVVKAGGIVLDERSDGEYILLIFRKAYRDWSFPKGHVEAGESLEQAAIREVAEECSIKTAVIGKLPANEYYNAKSQENTICYMFLLKPETLNTGAEARGDKVQWVRIDTVADKITNNNLKNYFRKILKTELRT